MERILQMMEPQNSFTIELGIWCEMYLIDFPNQLGCESHRYASRLQKNLAMLKEAKMKHIYLFQYDRHWLTMRIRSEVRENRSDVPIFKTNIYMEVLDEMGIAYLILRHEEVEKFKSDIQNRNVEAVRKATTVLPGDPDWFRKGVITNNISVVYAKLCDSKRLLSSRAPTTAPRPYQDDPILFSLHVLKYAFDLLTNFQNEGFTFVFHPESARKTMIVSEAYAIPKPAYEAKVCVFENGWKELGKLGLFEHFLKETVNLVDLQILDRLPEDARLLLIALVYYSRKRQVNRSAEAASVLLSYVTLGVVRENCDQENLPRAPFASRPVLDASTDEHAVTDDDCNTAAVILSEYLSLCRDVDPKLDKEIVYPLEEFQYCLANLHDLNVLCGRPVAPPAFRRLYSGSLVFRARCAMRAAGDERQFLSTLLSPAPTVLAFLSGLIEAYEEMLLSCQ